MKREERIITNLSKFPSSDDNILRLVLLHDPLSFQYIPNNDNCLVLSGHSMVL